MKQLPSTGEASIKLLEAYGVDTVFGIPGVHTLGFYRGLGGSALRHVTPRNEQGAGFMADGYGRMSGNPGVCILTTGPGLTNAATPIAQATSDSSPMLILSSVNARADLAMGRGRLHELRSQATSLAPLSGWNHTLLDGNDFPLVMARAFSTFHTQRPRPVHIEVPLDVLDQPFSRSTSARPLPSLPGPDHGAIDRACQMLSKATRPLIVVGGGAVRAADLVPRLAERIDAPVITTLAGAGILPADHPLSVGVALASKAGRELLRQADVVLAVGTELSETDHWTPGLPFEGRLIRIDIDPLVLVGDYEADIGILADCRAGLQALLDTLPRSRHGNDEAAQIAATTRVAVAEAIAASSPHNVRILAALRSALPRKGALVSDMTKLAYTANTAFPSYVPRSMLHPSGYGTLGFAVPAAIGAALAAPSRPLAVIVGDGGIQFTAQELATAAELNLSLPIILYNNSGYGQIRDGMRESGIEEIGVSFQNPDFEHLARAYHCGYRRPQTLKDLKRAVEHALAAQAPTLIEVADSIG